MENAKQPNKAIKILKITSSVIFYVIIGFLFLFAITTLTRKREDDIPNLFGLGFLAVHEKATSMVGQNDDSFNPGDLIFIKVLNKKQQEKLDLEKLYNDGAVISFFDESVTYVQGGAINTHRVVEHHDDSKGGYIITRGDNVFDHEGNPQSDSLHIRNNMVLGIYKGKIRGFGKVVYFMQTTMGFALVVILPMLLLLVWQGYILIRNVFQVKEQKLQEQYVPPQGEGLSEEERKRIKDEERERIRQELLKELEENKNKDK